jgi:hypothetical protein
MIRPVVLISSLIVLVLICSGCLTTPWEGNSVINEEKSGSLAESSPGWSGIFSGNGRSSAPLPTATPVADYSGELAADQKIIKTSRIALEVKNVTATLDPLKGIATAHGGYIGSLSVNTRYGDRLYAVLTMRVPSHEFDSAITEIKALGSLTSESLSADDVTEEYLDLQARRTALASQLAQYNRIMEKAENVSEILEVQVQIERVQVEIDRIDGRLKYLDNRVDYGTITVSLEEPEPVGGGEGFSIISVINEGIMGFLAVTAGLVIILISIIPLVILGAIVFVIYRWWKGRKGAIQKVPEEKEKKNEENPPGR